MEKAVGLIGQSRRITSIPFRIALSITVLSLLLKMPGFKQAIPIQRSNKNVVVQTHKLMGGNVNLKDITANFCRFSQENLEI